VLLGDDLVVLGMRTYPNPVHTTFHSDRKRTIVCTDAHRPMTPELLEMKRRVSWISFEKLITLSR
jgi:hypothetical protein